jgi:hypothetical protein
MRHREGALMECALPFPRGDIGSSPNSFTSEDGSLRKAETSLTASQLAIRIQRSHFVSIGTARSRKDSKRVWRARTVAA